MFVQVERRLFTVADYHRMAETGVLTADDRVELIQGEIIAMSPIGVRHAACVTRLTDLFTLHFRGQANVSVQNPLRLDEMSEPEPDVMLLKYREDYYAQETPSGDDVLLLVEVSDASLAYDKAVKLPLYARANIPEVWIVNLVDNVIEIFRAPKDDQYTDTRKAYLNDAVTAVSLPDVQFTTKELIGP